MSSTATPSGTAARSALICAVTMIAAQMAGKATRDAMFLTYFHVSNLPLFLIVSSALSLAAIWASSRAMRRMGPGVAVPAAFAVSGILFGGEWALARVLPKAATVVIYFHVSVVGAILISGFWSIVNERFDPRAAKKTIARLAGGATIGGLLGGVLAERMAVAAPVTTMLLVLGALNLLCAWATLDLKPSTRFNPDIDTPNGLEAIRNEPYLRQLAWLVFSLAMAAALLDYVFKAQASVVFRNPKDLLRFFAVFYAGVSLVSVVVQAALSRLFLRRLGLVRTTASLPLAVSVTGASALFFPGLGSALLARGTESILRGSLFRAGYELLYTAIPARNKRASKAIIDVGAERMGDMAGGGLTRLLLVIVPAIASSALMAIAAGLAVVALFIAQKLHHGYSRLLERNLIGQAVDLNLDDAQDSITKTIVLRTLSSIPVMRPGATGAAGEAAGDAPADLAETIAWLKSGDADKASRALKSARPLTRETAPFVIALLGRPELEGEATRALVESAKWNAGLLADALLDSRTSGTIQRLLAKILSTSDSPLAAGGLWAGVEGENFTTRYHAARSLVRMQSRRPGVAPESARVFAAVRRELAADRSTWRSRGYLDPTPGTTESTFANEGLGRQTLVSLEHVFTLLSLILPKQPLRIAFRGLHTDNPTLRGTALEYLESVLPSDIQRSLWPLLETSGNEPDRRSRSTMDAESELVKAHQTIELNLAAIREKLAREREEPPTS